MLKENVLVILIGSFHEKQCISNKDIQLTYKVASDDIFVDIKSLIYPT